mmetsp:Transcript_41372/g.102543  ORF Transcript_41372/g.102543 Transcript_41372/m.102543 type:complete len:256 (-) Transcript_41372:168-935(-)
MASSANLSSGGLEGLCNETTARWFYAWYSPYYDRLQKYFSSPHMREKGLDMAGVGGAEQRVLDVGAGTGTLTTQVLSRGALPGNVVMLDQSEGMLAQAKKKLQLNGVRKVLGDAQDLPFSDESFDRTISSGAIYYWPDAVRGMREQYRVLKPGGRAIMTSCAANPVHMFHDYWRFTMDAFKSLAVRFDSMDLCGSWGNGVVNAARALAGQFSGEPGSMLMKTVDGSEVVDPLSLKLAAQNEKDHAMTVWMIVRKL